jgi:hypothetical protein
MSKMGTSRRRTPPASVSGRAPCRAPGPRVAARKKLVSGFSVSSGQRKIFTGNRRVATSVAARPPRPGQGLNGRQGSAALHGALTVRGSAGGTARCIYGSSVRKATCRAAILVHERWTQVAESANRRPPGGGSRILASQRNKRMRRMSGIGIPTSQSKMGMRCFLSV